jgi:hypothetical protein
MRERRQYKRVAIPLSVLLGTITSDRKEVLDLVTRDISASGAFITTQTHFPEGTRFILDFTHPITRDISTFGTFTTPRTSSPEGTRFILDFTHPNDSLKEIKDIKSLKGLTGSMVRSNAHGIAIQFDNECQIESLKNLENEPTEI